MARTPPLISWVNVLRDATLTVSDETVDGVGLNAVDGLTYDYWVPSAAANIEFQLPSPAEVQCFGVAAHTLASSAVTIWLEYWNGSAWVEISRPYVSYIDVTIFDYFDEPVTSDLFRVNVSGPVAIGVLWVGPALQMERDIYQGHTPVTLAERNEQRSNQTETGEWRGVVQTIQGAELNASFQNLSASWVRSELAPFVTNVNEGDTFFWAWYVDKFPNEVAYCWNSGRDLQITNSGPRDLMSMTIQASAYLDGPNPVPPIVTTTPYFVYELGQVSDSAGPSFSADLRANPVGFATEEAKAEGAAVVSAELRDPIVPIPSSGPGIQEVESLGASVVSGALDTVVVMYQAEADEVESLGAVVVSGSLNDIVVMYEDDVHEIDATGAVVLSGELL